KWVSRVLPCRIKYSRELSAAMSKNRKIQGSSSGEGRGGGRSGSDDRRREVAGVVGLGAGLFLLIAMISLQAHTMVMGPFGRSTAGMFYGLAGLCTYLLVAVGVAAAIRMLLGREPVMPPLIVAGTLPGAVPLATPL